MRPPLVITHHPTSHYAPKDSLTTFQCFADGKGLRYEWLQV
jgi:hypothetical protein